MSAGILLQVIGIKGNAVARIKALEEAGCIPTAETVKCLHCQERYQLLIDPGENAPQEINILDLGQPVHRLVELVSADHASGHVSDLLVVEHQPHPPAAGPLRDAAQFLNLRSGERITALWAAEFVEDCRLCPHCQERAFRLVQIKSQAGKHRYVPLCAGAFMEACRALPELVDFEMDSVMKQVHEKMRA
jgi:hypothetical protein